MGIRDTINSIRGRHSLISPWPWVETQQGFCNSEGSHIQSPYHTLDICSEDADFIAHAPEDVENLLEMWENVCTILLADHPTSYDQLAALYEAVGLGWNDVLEYRRPSSSGIQPELREALVVRPFGRGCPQGAIALGDDGDVWVKEFSYAYDPKPWVMFRHEDGELAGGRYSPRVLARLDATVVAGVRRERGGTEMTVNFPDVGEDRRWNVIHAFDRSYLWEYDWPYRLRLERRVKSAWYSKAVWVTLSEQRIENLETRTLVHAAEMIMKRVAESDWEKSRLGTYPPKTLD